MIERKAGEAIDQNVSFYLVKSFESLQAQNLKLELTAIDSLAGNIKAIVVSSLFVSIVVGSYFKSALYHYLYDNRTDFKERPINVLILLQATLQHLVCLIMVATYTLGIGYNITFSEYLGEIWCCLLYTSPSPRDS